jgi:hypothetical protein
MKTGFKRLILPAAVALIMLLLMVALTALYFYNRQASNSPKPVPVCGRSTR